MKQTSKVFVLLAVYPAVPAIDWGLDAVGQSLHLDRQLVNIFIFALLALALNLQVGQAGLLQATREEGRVPGSIAGERCELEVLLCGNLFCREPLALLQAGHELGDAAPGGALG